MDDLISRQAAIDAIDEISREVDDGYGFDYEKWREYFCELPSAQPKRGRWIIAKEQRREDTENGNYMYNCSNCGCGDLHSKAVKVSYCWNCGADMRGEHDE